MKQQSPLLNKFMKSGEKNETLKSPSGPFCPITPPKDNTVLKGGALTSAFMSAFL